MFTSQPATSTSHWYVFSSFMFTFFLYVFCSLFLVFYVHFSASHLSQPLVCFFFFYVRFFAYFLLIFLYFFSASHLSQPSNHPPFQPFSLYRFITCVHYFFNPTITCL